MYTLHRMPNMPPAASMMKIRSDILMTSRPIVSRRQDSHRSIELRLPASDMIMLRLHHILLSDVHIITIPPIVPALHCWSVNQNSIQHHIVIADTARLTSSILHTRISVLSTATANTITLLYDYHHILPLP
jgi:hypothetical protein